VSSEATPAHRPHPLIEFANWQREHPGEYDARELGYIWTVVGAVDTRTWTATLLESTLAARIKESPRVLRNIKASVKRHPQPIITVTQRGRGHCARYAFTPSQARKDSSYQAAEQARKDSSYQAAEQARKDSSYQAAEQARKLPVESPEGISVEARKNSSDISVDCDLRLGICGSVPPKPPEEGGGATEPDAERRDMWLEEARERERTWLDANCSHEPRCTSVLNHEVRARRDDRTRDLEQHCRHEPRCETWMAHGDRENRERRLAARHRSADDSKRMAAAG
jgi:hypothetical protein